MEIEDNRQPVGDSMCNELLKEILQSAIPATLLKALPDCAPDFKCKPCKGEEMRAWFYPDKNVLLLKSSIEPDVAHHPL